MGEILYSCVRDAGNAGAGMRIAVGVSGLCLGKGGAERAGIRLAHEMLARGHETHVLATQGAEEPVYPLDQRLRVHYFPREFHLADPASVEKGPELLKANGIEIVVGMEWSWRHALWQACAEAANIPYVCSERITPYLIENKFWTPEGRRQFLGHCAAIHELLPTYLNFVQPELRERVFVIPNGEPEGTAEECPAPHAGKPALLYLGRFSVEKRPTLLLQAFGLLAQEFPEWELRFAGWGEEQAALEKLRKKLRLQKRVKIAPAQNDVGAEYGAANIYCLPTLHEGFPNTVLEAMSWGLPVVGAADCQAMTAVVKPGVTGLLAPRPTPEALAEVLRPLMASESARRRMGANGWRDCRANYNSRQIFDQWERELRRVIAAYANAG